MDSSPPDTLVLLPPAAQRCFQENEHSRQLLQEPLQQLDHALQKLEYEVGAGECPRCSSPGQPQTTQPVTSYDKSITTTGGLEIKVTVGKYECPVCEKSPVNGDELTLPQGGYDLALILVAVALYTCGCSYRATRNLLHTIYGIAPAISTLWNWVQTIGKKVGELNRARLRAVLVKRLQLDELFGYARSDPTTPQHQPFFITTALEDATGTVLLSGVNAGRQTNRLIVESYLRELKCHQPQEVAGDGCASYPGAVAAVFHQAQFLRDQIHVVRNLRSRPQVKKRLQVAQADIEHYWRAEIDQRLANDRQKFRTKLLAEFKTKTVTSSVRQQARNCWLSFLHWEQQERHAEEERLEQLLRLLEPQLQRFLYCSRLAARVARARRGERGPCSQPATTGRVEGFNRVLRQRIRQMLCFRSLESISAVINLLSVRHNMTGSGRGCLYDLLGVDPPSERWNPFYHFLPRKKTQSRATELLGTPFQHQSTKYRQQHSHQLPNPLTSLVSLLQPQISNASVQEVIKT